jgi:hypothetical protein
MTDVRAVSLGVCWGVAYLAVLAVPLFAAIRWMAIPLVLATGLIAGAAAGRAVSDPDPRKAGWHGFASAGLVGLGFAWGFYAMLAAVSPPPGVFYGLNYLLATNAGRFPVIATHGEWVVAGVSVAGGSLIALIGLFAGQRAPGRSDEFLLVEE